MIFIYNTDKELNNNDLLQFILSNGIINLDDVRDSMKQKEKERILSKHKYSIFQDKKDGRWKTTIDDETKKNGRRLIAKSKYEDLEKVLIDYYCSQEDAEYEKTKLPTLRNTFGEWLSYKNKHTNSSSYARRIKNDWNRFYENSSIVDKPVYSLTFIELDTWAHDIIKENHLTKKQYYNMTVIIRQMLDYLVSKKYIQENLFRMVEINSKMFSHTPKPKDETQVFNTKLEEEIKNLAMDKFNKNPKAITPLAILFNFNLGLRIGELVALKWSDIEGNYINIQRMEVDNYIITDNGDVIKNGDEIVDYTKTDAGTRNLYLNSEARKILSLVKKRSLEYGYYYDNYIFVNFYSTRLSSGSINKYLYNMCDELNTLRRSSHKIRKTYISSLFDIKLNINKIRQIAGHEDERTSLNNYCFDRNTDMETEEKLEALNRREISSNTA